MPYPLLSSLHLPILICINYYYHLKNLGLTSLSYYHSVTVNVLLNALILSPCLSGSLLSDPCIVATYNHFYIIYLVFRATERNIYFYFIYLFIYNWTFCCPVLGFRHCTCAYSNRWPSPPAWHPSTLALAWYCIFGRGQLGSIRLNTSRLPAISFLAVLILYSTVCLVPTPMTLSSINTYNWGR